MLLEARLGSNQQEGRVLEQYKALVHGIIRQRQTQMSATLLRRMSEDDVYQIGQKGLLNAVRMYDWRTRFTTYATACINYILSNAADHEGRGKRGLHKKVISLDLQFSDGDGDTIGSIVPGTSDDPLERIQKEQVRRLIAQEMDSLLTEREKQILLRRMDGETLQRIGTDCGVSRERIRQIEANAHSKLRVSDRLKEII